jgi:hypothetical protein
MIVAVGQAAVHEKVGAARAGVGVVLARLLVVLARLLVVLARLVGVGVLAAPQVRHGVGGVISVHRRRSVVQGGVLFSVVNLKLNCQIFLYSTVTHGKNALSTNQ